MDGTVLLDGVIAFSYLVGYLTCLYVQPVLNRLTRAVLEGSCCCRGASRRPELEHATPTQTLGIEPDVEMVDLTPPPLCPGAKMGKMECQQVIVGRSPVQCLFPPNAQVR